jgi:hypothetical protein
MKCPQCQSSEIYRKSLKSLNIYCDNCEHQWKSKQVREALSTVSIQEKSYPHHKLNIGIYLCPIDQNKYSFSINNGNGIMAFYEFEDDQYLSGCYESIKEALEARIKEASK